MGSAADLAQLQLQPYLGPLQPGQQVVIKVMKGIHEDNLRQLAEHEEGVLRAVTEKGRICPGSMGHSGPRM